MALADNLDSYYPFESDATDSVGSNDGTVTNATITTGKNGNCYTFDGTGDYINLNTSAFATAAGTISCWFNTDDATSVKFIIGSRNGSTNDMMQINIDGGNVDARIRASGTNYDVVGTASISTGTWYHFVLSWGSAGMKTYVDGSDNGTNAYTGSLTPVSNYYVGSVQQFLGSNDFDGEIDEVGFWSRQLSDAEVTELYNSGSGKFYPFTTLNLSTPNGGEFVRPGDSYEITWTDSGSVTNVKLELSTNSGGAYSDIVASTSNDGSYSWTVPSEDSTTCLVRVSDAADSGNNDVSDAVFSIKPFASSTTGGGSFVYSWLILVDRMLSGAVDTVIEMSNTAIKDYLWKPAHVQITGDFRARVVKVHDGDTITLRTDFRDFDFPLRIANIDALEMNSGGQFAKDWLTERVLNRDVDVYINPLNRVGKYGRLIGEVFVDGLNVGEEMANQLIVAEFGSIKHRIEPLSKIFQREVDLSAPSV